MRVYDRLLIGDRRATTCGLAKGRTLELGIGTGLNLPWYPPEIELVGVDLNASMLSIAAGRARELGLDVELKLGDAQDLDLPDDSFDTVVATLLLSTIPDPRHACAEAFRVLRPGGHLLLLDHVRSPVAAVRWVQWLFEPLASLLFHVHLQRDPLDYLEMLGFRIGRCVRARGGLVEEVLVTKVLRLPVV
jgi:ubiquinone/menaquinone biosynthesis C-methylase UbiE